MKCHIAKDLLPNYIDELVSPETKHEIDTHLAECPSCRKISEDMKTPMEIKSDTVSNSEVNFLKKIKRRSKLQKGIGIALSLLILLFVICIIIFGVGNKVNSDVVMIRTEFQKASISGGLEGAYLDKEWVIHFNLTNGNALIARDDNVTDESGKTIGCIIKLYEAPLSKIWHECDNYTMGYSYVGDVEPTEDYTVTVRFKDKDIIYSMKEEGLYMDTGDISSVGGADTANEFIVTDPNGEMMPDAAPEHSGN